MISHLSALLAFNASYLSIHSPDWLHDSLKRPRHLCFIFPLNLHILFGAITTDMVRLAADTAALAARLTVQQRHYTITR